MASGFTSHNIKLDDGSLTRPEQPWQMDELALLKFTKQFLRMLYPDGVAGKRLVDLGCLEGGYTVELARAGFDALRQGDDCRLEGLTFTPWIYPSER